MGKGGAIEKELKIKNLSEINRKIEIERDTFNFGVAISMRHSTKEINTPLVMKSYLNIKFNQEKDIKDIIEYYRKVGEFFKFLYNRKYIRFDEIKLFSKGKVKDKENIYDTTNTFEFCYCLPDEDKLDIPDSIDIIKFDQIEKNIDKLYFSINQKGVYRNYYDLNVEEETKITINKYHNISSAFESWFDINFPEFKSESDKNYLNIKNNILKYINNNK